MNGLSESRGRLALQRDDEGRPAARDVVEFDLPSMRLRDPFGDREPETAALAHGTGRLGAVEAFENAVSFGQWNANSRIGNAEGRRVGSHCRQLNAYVASGRRVFNRVVD